MSPPKVLKPKPPPELGSLDDLQRYFTHLHNWLVNTSRFERAGRVENALEEIERYKIESKGVTNVDPLQKD